MTFTDRAAATMRHHRLDWLAALSAAVAASAVVSPAALAKTPRTTMAQQQAPVAPVCAPWEAATVYVAGDTATRNGLSYRANWWTQGEDPALNSGPPGSGKPWTQIDSCAGTPPPPPPPPAPCDPWRGDVTYTKGTLVTQSAKGYKAMAKSINLDPATHSGPKGSGEPWTPSAKCNAPPPPPGGVMYTSYKDITINLNWNTNELSTKVTGPHTTMLSVLPARQQVATWAFASGECGAETWAGVKPADLVAANVAKWVAAGKKYIISTGGAAGSFHCSSDAGFDKFISTYNSAGMLGVDFDIESGQTQEVIDNLVARTKWAQTKYPQMRFSFTLATFGGNLPQSLGQAGVRVMNSIKAQGLQNYIINLMTMDYGSPTPGNCTLGPDGECDMGKSAINAAINLHNHWGVPYHQIEVTPMIGGNDTPNETFTLEDTDELSAWVMATGLSGVHIWSFDRDNDCPPGWASPTCNTYGQAGTLGFTNRFLTKLGK